MKYFDIYFNRLDESGNIDDGNGYDHGIYSGPNEQEAKEAYEDAVIYEHEQLKDAPDGFGASIVFNQYTIKLKEGEEVSDYLTEERGLKLQRSCDLIKDGEKVKTFRHRATFKN